MRQVDAAHEIAPVLLTQLVISWAGGGGTHLSYLSGSSYGKSFPGVVYCTVSFNPPGWYLQIVIVRVYSEIRLFG